MSNSHLVIKTGEAESTEMVAHNGSSSYMLTLFGGGSGSLALEVKSPSGTYHQLYAVGPDTSIRVFLANGWVCKLVDGGIAADFYGTLQPVGGY